MREVTGLMTDEVTGSLLNFQAGGLREDGVHDPSGLMRAFLDDPSPDFVAICEAKEWHRDGERPFLAAMRELSVLSGRPYVGELHTGPIGTAIIYDPNILCLLQGEDPRYPDRRNRARFALRADGMRRFDLRTEHWSYSDSSERFARAQRLAQYGTSEIPTLVMGDLNESASGPDFPDLDWDTVPIEVRDYVAYRNEHGDWMRQSSALDRLTGPYDAASGGRIDSSGFHIVAEQDPLAVRPFPATSNVRNLHVDYALMNDAMRRAADVVAGSYHVHVPAGGRSRWPSDHRRISFALRFRRDRKAA